MFDYKVEQADVPDNRSGVKGVLTQTMENLSLFEAFAANYAKLGKRPERNAFSTTTSEEVMTRRSARPVSARSSMSVVQTLRRIEVQSAGHNDRRIGGFDVLGASI